jgi:hypothetical protein
MGNVNFLATFDGDPEHPQPWQPDDWDVTIHSRDKENFYELTQMQAGHGPNCEPPPATHLVSAYEDAVYICRSHVMTAIDDDGYGVIYLTPDHMVDFSSGEAVIRFDLSTARTSTRDWVDLWISPYEDHLQLPLTSWLPDLSGEPRRAVQIEMGAFNGNTIFTANVIRNFESTAVDGNWWVGYEEFLTPSAMQRETFELRLSHSHIKFGMPDYDFWWVDADIPGLDWTQGVVQFGHHSYNPTKDCNNPCGPNTWHWDNLAISQAVPFTIIHTDRRFVEPGSARVNLSAPAPANAYLRFAAIGKNIEVSFDGGVTWQKAQIRPQLKYEEDKFWSYLTPIFAGATTVHFRGEPWWGGTWMAKDITVWSK